MPQRDFQEYRRDDIPDLVKAFTKNTISRLGRRPIRVTRAALRLLMQASWPGNVRELENVIFRSISLLDGDILDAEHIIFNRNNTRSSHTQGRARTSNITFQQASNNYQSTLEGFEKAFFQNAFQNFESTWQLANKIGVSHTTVARKLKKYGIPDIPNKKI